MKSFRLSSLFFSIIAGLLIADSVRAQDIPLRKIDGHTIVSGVRTVTKSELAESVIRDLMAQGTHPQHPRTGKYALRFGGTVTRVFFYVNAEKGRFRWERNSDFLKMTPDDLAEQVLLQMMKDGRLQTLTPPSTLEYAKALMTELSKRGLGTQNPLKQKFCVKLGYKHCKILLSFDEGSLEWAYKGIPFMKGNFAEAILREAQALGQFKTQNGKQDLIIVKGQDEKADEDEFSKIEGVGALEKKNDLKAKPVELPETQAINQESQADELEDADEEPNLGESFSRGTSPRASEVGQAGTGSGSGGNGTGQNGSSRMYGVRRLKDGHETRRLLPCGTLSDSGGYGVTVIPMNFGSRAGEVVLEMDALDVKDSVEVTCNNQIVASKRPFKHNATLKFNFIPFSTGEEANICKVTVTGKEEGTIWKLAVSCPR